MTITRAVEAVTSNDATVLILSEVLWKSGMVMSCSNMIFLYSNAVAGAEHRSEFVFTKYTIYLSV